MAERLAPIMAEALLAHEDTANLGEILRDWDYVDLKDAVAPTIFQSVYRHFALRTFRDELGDAVSAQMFGNYYFWVVRLETMVAEGDSAWFDDVTTAERTETRDDLFHLATQDTIREFAPRYLNDPRGWKWGRVHHMAFTNPLRPSGFLSGILGGGSHAVDGSGETLYRGIYAFSKPYDVAYSAALRMVADLGDAEKVIAVMPSGVSGRTLDRHYTDQVKQYINGEKLYWWFSDDALERHTLSTLTLDPMGR
jgi:penicillin amidase